ncbi:MAG: hypothetical protein GY894_06145 [Planctomycetes bacterium]|nr:hypothetical protein [Planctomycetota bacterium]MCP4838925.1 hypothetical protein [Planctomycetota bacterium]
MKFLSNAPPGATISSAGISAKGLLLVFLILAACNRSDPQESSTPPLTKSQSEYFGLIQAGETGAARIRLRQRIDAGESDSRLPFLMGLAHHWDRNYTRAAEWFARAETAEPVYPPASHFLGWSLYHAGNLDKSKMAFHRHLQLAPDEGDSLFALGVLAIEQGNLDLADDYLSRAILVQRGDPARAPGVAKAMVRQAEIAEVRDSVDASIELLRQAIEINDDLYEAHYRLARLLQRRGYGEESAKAQQNGDAAKARVEAQDLRAR